MSYVLGYLLLFIRVALCLWLILALVGAVAMYLSAPFDGDEEDDEQPLSQ